MSASERLIAARRAVEEFTQLAEGGDDLLDELLDAYAHELAEQQRTYAQRMEEYPHFGNLAPGVRAAADHIDPEVRDD